MGRTHEKGEPLSSELLQKDASCRPIIELNNKDGNFISPPDSQHGHSIFRTTMIRQRRETESAKQNACAHHHSTEFTRCVRRTKGRNQRQERYSVNIHRR